MGNGSGGADASVLFNLSEFKVIAHTMREGEWWLLVETNQTRAGCPSCGVLGVGNGRRRVLVRDLPIGGVPVVLVWAKRTWRCRVSTAIDFSPWADVGFPRVWPGGFPGGGHGFPRGVFG